MSGENRWGSVDRVADIFHKAVEQAIVLQRSATKSSEQSERTSLKLKELSESLPTEISAAVAGKLEAAAVSAAETMVQKWSDANAAAMNAAATYRKAESALTWKLIFCISSGLIATGILLAGLIWYLTPAELELQALREERRALAADIERLRKMGAAVDVATCKYNNQVRPCVRVDPESPIYDGSYRLLPRR